MSGESISLYLQSPRFERERGVKIQIDEYRVSLFKKKLRNIIGAPWLRFYFSKGKCHLCFKAWDLGYEHSEENVRIAMADLTLAGVEFKTDKRLFGDGIWSVNIPIDQEQLPERKRCLAKKPK